MKHRQSRVMQLIALLKSHKGRRVPLPEVIRAGGGRYGARLAEARAQGYIIRNFLEHGADGQTHSWYILHGEPGETTNLFPDLPSEKQSAPYRDPEEHRS
jgi:hypothetical protein